MNSWEASIPLHYIIENNIYSLGLNRGVLGSVRASPKIILHPQW